MSKYIVEIKPEYEDSFKGLMILGAKDSNLFVDTLAVEDLEELNSDYINEHFGDMQDTAYQKGFDDAHRISEEEYQRGLDDAWEVVKALFQTFGTESACVIMKNDNVHGAIDRLKAYEEKQKADDKIEVGDEVIYNNTMKCLVVRPETDERYASLIDSNGSHHSAEHSECKKTGRHFDIASILEAMKA